MKPHKLLVAAMLMANATAFADTAQPVKAPTIAKELQQAKTYTISSPPTAPLEMAKPALPDLSGYTDAAMEKDRQKQAGQDQHPPHDAGRRPQGLHRR